MLIVGLCLFMAATLCPPWRPRVSDSPYDIATDRVQYSPAWRTPYFTPKGERYKVYLTVDLKLLAVEWVGIAVVTSGLITIFRKPKRSSPR